MSKLADQLNRIRAFNNWDLLKKFGAPGDVAIEYTPQSEGWMGWGDASKTTVWSPYGHPKLIEDGIHLPQKKFLGKRSETFQLAVNWAMAEFGHDYVVSPFGGRIPDHVLHKAKRALTSTDQEKS